jgi:hypothetical protein
VKKGIFKSNIPTNHGKLETIILRSWMLNDIQYVTLNTMLIEKGYELINGIEQYLEAHYFPRAYSFIGEHAGLAWWTGEWANQTDTEKVDWKSIRDYLGGDVLIKDYVKSEKGNPELFILKKELSNEDFYSRILRFVEARGKLFNRGVVFKQVQNLKQYAGQTNEWRVFFLNGQPVTMSYNGNQKLDVPFPQVELIVECSNIAKKMSNKFLTIDVAEKENGEWMILEAGDGQVSGLAAQEEPIKFYSKLQEVLQEQVV